MELIENARAIGAFRRGSARHARRHPTRTGWPNSARGPPARPARSTHTLGSSWLVSAWPHGRLRCVMICSVPQLLQHPRDGIAEVTFSRIPARAKHTAHAARAWRSGARPVDVSARAAPGPSSKDHGGGKARRIMLNLPQSRRCCTASLALNLPSPAALGAVE